MNISFKNKTVLVTGASRGIGREVARYFADNDARVIVHYNSNLNAAEDTLSLLKGEGHGLIRYDFSDCNCFKKFFNDVIKIFGSIDILINNAGIIKELDVTSIDFKTWKENWDETLSINLTAAAHLSFLFAKDMTKNGGGKIINVSSRGAFRGEPGAPVYGASKAGMNAFGQSFAKALAPHNVFVYTVAPGFVETEMSTEMLQGERGDEIKNQSPFGRVATPQEVAHAVVLLAAEGNDFMTGCILDINGASYLRT